MDSQKYYNRIRMYAANLRRLSRIFIPLCLDQGVRLNLISTYELSSFLLHLRYKKCPRQDTDQVVMQTKISKLFRNASKEATCFEG